MKSAIPGVIGVVVVCSVSVAAQWGKFPTPGVPRDAQGKVNMDAPPPRTADGKIDFSGIWMRANSGPGRGGRGRGRGGRRGRAPAGRGTPNAPRTECRGSSWPGSPARHRPPAVDRNRRASAGGRGGVTLEPATAPFPFDPTAPPVATFFEAGGNMEGGLPYTPWAAEIRKKRFEVDKAKDNPDAMCMPMGFLQFHQQPQPRKIMTLPGLILIEYEANYGLRHIYMDGRKLPPQGEPQPWWYGYSVGRWEGDTLVVETNNLRGAEDGPYDGWLDVNGSPYSREAKFTERIPPADLRPPDHRHHGRGPEGVHQAVDGPRRSAHHGRTRR